MNSIKELAHEEFRKEKERELVEIEKQKLRERDNRSFWQKLFPFKITITRR